MCNSGFASSVARFFKNIGGIPSGPGPLLESKLRRAPSTSCGESLRTDMSVGYSGINSKKSRLRSSSENVVYTSWKKCPNSVHFLYFHQDAFDVGSFRF